jgi:hypothetical protein
MTPSARVTVRLSSELREGNAMLRKLCIFAAVGAALFISPAAFAGHGHHHGHRYDHHVKNDWNDRINWNAPLRGRWWGGRWWGYGEGACWRWTPSGYIWICR